MAEENDMRVLAIVAALSVLLAGSANAAGDAAAGQDVFKKCAACHAAGEGAKNRVGPVLNDLFGRVAGTYPNYKYSQAMIDAGAAGLTWTPDTFGPYIHKPKDVVPGTKMTFGGLPDQTDIDNLTAYLLTLSPNYVAAPPADAATTSSSAASAPAAASSSAAQ
jgi:cytochrome c2